jgi:phosphoglycerol transferase MdoB-like AlkP superfamily enzyme
MLLMMSGVSKIVSKDEFPSNENLQKWGVSDEFLYQRLFNDLQKTPQPFMSMVYNISSHEPFDIPGKYNKYPGNDSQSKYFNAVAYTDSCLGKFVAEMKNSELWKNTLIVITADHASLEPGPTSLEDLNTFKIPLIWIGGVVDKAMKVENIGSQTDVGTTLLQQLGWDSKTSCFAKNLFAKKDYAFFYNIDGWGYVSPAVAFYTNAETNNRRFYYGQNEKTTASTLKKAQAYTQYLHQDFINR